MAAPVCACAEAATSATPSRTANSSRRILPPAPRPERHHAAVRVIRLKADRHVSAPRADLDCHHVVHVDQLVYVHRTVHLIAVEQDRHWAATAGLQRGLACRMDGAIAADVADPPNTVQPLTHARHLRRVAKL